MSDKSKPQKKTRCIGVNRIDYQQKRELTAYEFGKALEKAINKLERAGYETSLLDLEGGLGIVVIGHKSESHMQVPTPIGLTILQNPGNTPSLNINCKSDKTEMIASRAMQSYVQASNRTGFIKDKNEFRKTALGIFFDVELKSLPHEELVTIAEDMDHVATEHDKLHAGGNHNNCEFPEILRDLAAIIKERAQFRLQ